MFLQLAPHPNDLLTSLVRTVERPATDPRGRSISWSARADAEAPMFALLRTTVGLPVDDSRWWPEELRPAVHVTHPSIDLLERTLAGLRALDTTRPVLAVAGRHVRR